MYRNTYVLDYGNKLTLKKKLHKEINEFIARDLLLKKTYSYSESKYLVLHKINFLNLNLGTVYPSNRMDIPAVSLVSFFLIFAMLVFSFMLVLNSLKVFSNYTRKKNSVSSFFYNFSDVVSSFLRSSVLLKKKIVAFYPKIKKAQVKPLGIDREIIGLVKDINTKQNNEEKSHLFSLKEIKKKVLQNKSNLLIIPDQEKIASLENLFNNKLKKISLLFPFKKELFMIKEYKNFTKESIDRFLISRNDFIYVHYLVKNQMVSLNKHNSKSFQYLKKNLSSKDLAEIEQVAILPIKKGDHIGFILFLAY